MCEELRYYTIKEFIESKCTLRDRILAIEALIDQMILSLADNISSGNISQYEMDDGQMRVRTSYKSSFDVENGIKNLEKMKQMYLNRLNGSVTILRDKSAFQR